MPFQGLNWLRRDLPDGVNSALRHIFMGQFNSLSIAKIHEALPQFMMHSIKSSIDIPCHCEPARTASVAISFLSWEFPRQASELARNDILLNLMTLVTRPGQVCRYACGSIFLPGGKIDIWLCHSICCLAATISIEIPSRAAAHIECKAHIDREQRISKIPQGFISTV